MTYSPALSARNQPWLVMPGTVSILRRKAGAKNPWITSLLVSESLTGMPTGTTRVPLCLPFGYSKSQDHMRAMTLISRASAGASRRAR